MRESVRLKGSVVLTQRNTAGDDKKAQQWNTSVGLSSWGVDIHAVKRVVIQVNGTTRITNAGGHDTFRSKTPLLPIALVEVPYEAMTPQANDTTNLLVPVCASFTHVAFSTYRLEPQYAIFGAAAGAAAALAVSTGASVQEVNVSKLQKVLVAQGQIIKLPVSSRL